MLQDINPKKLNSMDYEELLELAETEKIDIGQAKSKSGLIMKINVALREAGIEPEPDQEVEKPKETKKKVENSEKDLNETPRKMLLLCKNSKKVKIRCDAIYEPIFGKNYTFLLNCVPVTVRFDGTEQEFPEPVAKRIQEKLNEVSLSNAVKSEDYEELF